MKRSDGDGIDAGALRDTVERALASLAEERKVKQQLTGAKTGIDRAYEIVEAMAAAVRSHLNEIDALVRTACADGEEAEPRHTEPEDPEPPPADQLAL